MSNKPLAKTSLITRGNGLVSSNIYGDIVLMNIETGTYYDLDEVGSLIWEILEKPLSVSDIIAHVLLNYEIDQATCETEVMHFLQNLNDYELLEIK